jgi:Holliday junction resolvase
MGCNHSHNNNTDNPIEDALNNEEITNIEKINTEILPIEMLEVSNSSNQSKISVSNVGNALKIEIENSKAEKAKKEKEEANRITEFANNLETPEYVSLRYRYENAKLMQQKVEEERLNRIKRRKSNVKSKKIKWENSVIELLDKQENRYNETKHRTISQFRLTDGTGIVKKITGKLEELFIQNPPSSETISMTIQSAKSLLKNSSSLQYPTLLDRQNFQINLEYPEQFELGSTRLYNINLLEPHIVSYLKRLMNGTDENKHVTFPCGVYCEQATKPFIEVCACAIKSNNSTIFIVLSIRSNTNKECDARVNGRHKIAVFDHESNQKILEKFFDIQIERNIENACFDENQNPNRLLM